MNISTDLNIKQQELELIKQLIGENAYYEGNEDLLPQFCEEVYQKSYLLFKSVKNYSYLIGYLRKIVNNSVVTVLKSNGRTKRLNFSSKTKHMTSQDNYSFINKEEIMSMHSENSIRQKGAYNIYKIEDPCTEHDLFEPDRISMEKTLELLEYVNSENLDKRYLQIFVSRYIQHKSSEAIAFDFNLSESEVNQRLVEVADIIRENM